MKNKIDIVSIVPYNVSVDNKERHTEHAGKEGKSMLEIKKQDITLQENREVIEFIEILKKMSESERQQIKGVMIGIQLSKGTVRTA